MPTPDEQLTRIIDRYQPVNAANAADTLADARHQFALIERSTLTGDNHLTVHPALADAAAYHDSQAAGDRWSVVAAYDLHTGDRWTPTTATTLEKAEPVPERPIDGDDLARDVVDLWRHIEHPDRYRDGRFMSAADTCSALYELLGRHGMPVS